MSFAIGALFLGLVGLYLLTFSGKLHSIDEFALFSVADSLAQRGKLDINALWWAQKSSSFPPGIPGPDGNLYSKMAPGMSLAALPFVWLGRQATAFGAVPFAHLANVFVTAATFAVLSLYLLSLGVAMRKAVVVAALAGTTTLAWPYARFLFAAPLLSFGLVATLHFARRGRPWLAGVGLAVALLTRLETVVALPWLVWYLWRPPAPAASLPTRRPPAERWSRLSRFTFPIVVAGALLLGYNWLRFGSLSSSGYGGELRFAFQPKALLTLLWGPGLGFFIYAPVLLAGLVGIRRSFRRWPRETILSLGLAVTLWGFYGSWHAWDGGWGWGPRFLAPLIPLLCLPLAALLDGPTRWHWPVYPTALAGFLVNAAGATVDFNDFFMTRDLISAAQIDHLADWPPLVHMQLFLQGQRDLAGLAATWPALVLLALGGIGVFYVVSGRPLPSAQGKLWPLLPGLAALLIVALPVAARTDSNSLPAQTRQDLALVIEIVNERSSANDVGLVSLAPYVPVSETMAYLLNHWHSPLPLWAWISDEAHGFGVDAEKNLIRQATANHRYAWLWQQPAAGSPDLATTGPLAALSQIAFTAGGQQVGQSGYLSHFSLPASKVQPDLHSLQLTFGDGLTLTGFNATIQRSRGVQAALFWQALPNLGNLLSAGDVVASLRLQDEAGQTVAQVDRLLISREFALQSLEHLGQAGRQGIALDLPPDLPTGSYELTLQLYHGGSQAVIPADSGEAVIRLAILQLDD